MPTNLFHQAPNESADDLTIARRALLRAQEGIARLEQQKQRARQAIVRAQRALGETGRKRAHRLAKSLASVRRSLDVGYRARVDGQIVILRTDRSGLLRFLGMWRPPSPPESPQESGCSAVICTCLEYLRSSTQVRQHWETGCFDVPDYEALEGVGPYFLLEELEEGESEHR